MLLGASQTILFKSNWYHVYFHRSLDVPSVRGQKVLITGGGGFFGIHLARALHMLGCSVLITDKGNPIEDYQDDIKFVQV